MFSCSRVFASLVAGLATGILGVTGWGGFAYYLLAHALVWLLKSTNFRVVHQVQHHIHDDCFGVQLGFPLYLKAKGQPTEYLQSGYALDIKPPCGVMFCTAGKNLCFVQEVNMAR